MIGVGWGGGMIFTCSKILINDKSMLPERLYGFRGIDGSK